MKGVANSLCGYPKGDGSTCRKSAGWGTRHKGEGRCRLHGGNGGRIKSGEFSRYGGVKRPRIRELLESLEGDPDPTNLLPEIELLRALILDYVERYDEQTEALINWHASFNPQFSEEMTNWRVRRDRWQSEYAAWLGKWEAYREEVERVQHHYRGGWPEPTDAAAFDRPPEPPEPADFALKPREVPDILSVGKFIGQIGALAERIHKQQQEGTISLQTLNQLLQQFGVEMYQAAVETVHDESVRAAILGNVEARWSRVVLPGSPGSQPRSRGNP